jgi:hypothetical protein
MPVPFQEILNSRLFKFILGEEADGTPSEFFVHEDAIAQLSKPLYTLTKGGLPDARAGRATWKGVSKETFERFVQFAYTGDYSIPKPEKRNATMKLEKTEMSVPTHPSLPSAPNGIRRRNGSEASASTVEPHDRSASVFDNELGREPVPEKVDDDSECILNYPNPSKKHRKKKKKKGKIEIKASLPEPESEPEPELAAHQPAEPQPDLEPAEPKLAESKPADPEPVESELVESEPVVPEPQPAELQPAEPELDPESTPIAARENYPEQPSYVLAADFHLLPYPLLAQRDNYHGTCEPAGDFDKEQSYSKVLLSHASLYVLGDFQLIDSLKAMALFKLHKTLCAFKLDNENIGDITDLARYAYSKEVNGFDERTGGLRGLVCQYMAIHALELSLDAKFMNLLAEGGQIVKDFFRFQLQRVH